jgi:hypothetical protein
MRLAVDVQRCHERIRKWGFCLSADAQQNPVDNRALLDVTR